MLAEPAETANMKFKFHRRDITGFEAHQIIYSAQEKYYENDRKYTLPYKKAKCGYLLRL